MSGRSVRVKMGEHVLAAGNSEIPKQRFFLKDFCLAGLSWSCGSDRNDHSMGFFQSYCSTVNIFVK